MELVGHIQVLVADRHMDNDVIVAVDDAAYEQDACDNDAMWVAADDNDRDDDMEGMDDEEYEDDDTVNTKEMVSHEVGEFEAVLDLVLPAHDPVLKSSLSNHFYFLVVLFHANAAFLLHQ